MIILLTQRTERTERRAARAAASCVAGVCIAVLSSCSTLDSPESDEIFSSQAYVGAGVLASHLQPDTDEVAGTSVNDSWDSGGSVTLGYDVTPRLSVEGHLASLGEAAMDPAGTIGYTVGGISGLYYGFNGALDRAHRNGFAVFGRLGLGAMKNNVSGVESRRVNDVHLLAGVGLEVGVNRGLGLRAELVAHETDAKYAQLGFVYRFSRQPGGAGEVVSGAVKPSLVDDAPIISPVAGKSPAVIGRYPDSDSDSVPNSDSDSDSKPVVKSPVQTPASVSQPDADGDKVPDARDQCPNTVAGTPVKVDGCPVFDGVVDGINFREGSDTLTDKSIIVLADIAETLREYPDIRIIIRAHTDNRGDAAGNLQLSKRRAIAVARYLIGASISGSRLMPKAYGESQPRVSNQTAQGRAANRRVEFAIVP